MRCVLLPRGVFRGTAIRDFEPKALTMSIWAPTNGVICFAFPVYSTHLIECISSSTSRVDENGLCRISSLLILPSSDQLRWRSNPSWLFICWNELWEASHNMFKGLKSSGFNIEDSHFRDRGRMPNLFSIIIIAYVWCNLVGIFIHENINPIKVLEHGRRSVSFFKYGLDYISQCLMNHTERYQINVFKFFVIYLDLLYR